MSTLGVMPVFIRSNKELAITCQAIASWSASCVAPLTVIDDASPDQEYIDKLVDFMKQYDNVLLVRQPSNEGFAATVNVGLRQALEAKYDAVLVNSDIEFMHTDWLAHMEANDAWVVGALLVYPNKLIQHAGIYYSVITRTFDHIFKYAPGNLAAAQEKRVCPVTGALQYIRLESLREIGLYDEGFSMGWEDVSWCIDVFSHGERCIYEPTAVAIHHESLFRGKNKTSKIQKWENESWLYLHKKHAGLDFSAWMPTMIEGHWE